MVLLWCLESPRRCGLKKEKHIHIISQPSKLSKILSQAFFLLHEKKKIARSRLPRSGYAPVFIYSPFHWQTQQSPRPFSLKL